MTSYTFTVQGSAPEPYTVIVSRKGDNLTATCTCPAGQNGTHCKHRLRILLGDESDIVSDNIAEVSLAADLLAGTDVERAVTLLGEAEEQLSIAKRLVRDRKKMLARVLVD